MYAAFNFYTRTTSSSVKAWQLCIFVVFRQMHNAKKLHILFILLLRNWSGTAPVLFGGSPNIKCLKFGFPRVPTFFLRHPLGASDHWDIDFEIERLVKVWPLRITRPNTWNHCEIERSDASDLSINEWLDSLIERSDAPTFSFFRQSWPPSTDCKVHTVDRHVGVT